MIRENSVIQKASDKMLEAIESGDQTKQKEALANFGTAIAETIKEEFESAKGDQSILQARGFRVLTAKETAFYEDIITAGKSNNPKQTYDGLLDNRVMPVTIIEDIYHNLQEEHPLLEKINFVSVAYLTRWILNDHSTQTAVWGAVNSAIAQEIASAFKVVEVSQCKLSAFALIEKDMLDLGPQFLDNYIRAFLKEAIATALETAIVTGTGNNQPIGLDRDIHQGVSVTGGVYPRKQKVKLTSFLPDKYGAVLAGLAVTEAYYTDDSSGEVTPAETAANKDGSAKAGYTKHGGKMRSFDEVTLICNQVDFLTKVMPASTVLNASGVFAKDVFPFPTDVVRCNKLETGEAILCLPEEYFMGLGTSKDGTIDFSDEIKFFEDQRAFKIKLHGMGKAYDNTVAILLDISALEAAYIPTMPVA